MERRWLLGLWEQKPIMKVYEIALTDMQVAKTGTDHKMTRMGLCRKKEPGDIGEAKPECTKRQRNKVQGR